MKTKSEIFPDRPKPPSSGVPFKYKVKVQRRTDILMQEQLENVANLQDALQQSLDDTERTDIGEEVAFHKDQIEQLWGQLEEALVVLKVMYKLNTELKYARLELEKMLDQMQYGADDVNVARKRVGWLEDHMEQAIGKKRMKSPARANMHSGAFNREQLMLGQRAGAFRDCNSSTMDDLESRFPHVDRLTSSATDVPEKLHRAGEEEHPRERPQSIMRQRATKGSSGRDSRVTILLPEKDGKSHQLLESQLSTDRPPRSPNGREAGSSDTKAEVNVSSTTTSKLMGMLVAADKSKEAKDKPEKVDYWESEHHRFEHVPEADAICEVYPLSYHQMGLAVPGTFVEEIKGNPDLPLRQTRGDSKAEDQSDGYNEALQGISERVHTLYQRVSDAAMFSVTGKRRERMNMKTIIGLNKFMKQTQVSRAKPSISRILKQRKTVVSESGSLPDIKKDRIGTSKSGRLVFYPKPLPYPENLPLTRTKTDQVFPRDSEVFISTDIDDRPTPKRIVRQHNLYNETKFTSSLFRPKPVVVNDAPEKFTPTPVNLDSAKRMNTCTFKGVTDVVKAVVTFKGAGIDSNWNDMKPKSNPMEHSGLKWERVKDIVHRGLNSPFTDERVDAAKHLGALKCGDATVIYSLKERLKHDEDNRVRYEALKSLFAQGCWEEESLAAAVRFMIDGNQDIRLDLVKAMVNGKNVMFIDKKLPSFAEIAKILSLLSMNENPSDRLSLDAAICLGRMCISDKHGSAKLLQALRGSDDYNFKAEALEILVRQVNYPVSEMMPFMLNQLKDSPVWRYRKAAASLLVYIGKMQLTPEHLLESMYQECELSLWNDPITDVRKEVTRALAALNMYARACEMSEKKLEDTEEEIRAQGVISLNSLGTKNQRIKRTLVEMLELDSSDYVRILIMKLFSSLNIQDKRIIRALREKEKGDGPLARSAKNTLEDLATHAVGNASKVKKAGLSPQ